MFHVEHEYPCVLAARLHLNEGCVVADLLTKGNCERSKAV